ncbi:hypothetical protein [Streptomyces turgidiscabies]|uniref:hypothetical protein n=1 Tax=Streptomyces turgidiscabies TaxID=85558 RepID=UPI0027D830FA|nr:hypothetical protein [Streptomyces turgidiscabies]
MQGQGGTPTAGTGAVRHRLPGLGKAAGRTLLLTQWRRASRACRARGRVDPPRPDTPSGHLKRHVHAARATSTEDLAHETRRFLRRRQKQPHNVFGYTLAMAAAHLAAVRATAGEKGETAAT